MSILQKETLSRFFEETGKKTLDEYSTLTGIERTRLFRLFHGAEMKIGEFEIFQSFLKQNSGDELDWKNVIQEIQDERLSGDMTKEFRIQWEREKRLSDYLQDMPKAA
ncbi:MAG: hypothetical protein K9K67_01205 [Bacteriovoracaceae bacterium]|nr:hypothetical protein [Bacteriovoracaceae bacterium]